MVKYSPGGRLTIRFQKTRFSPSHSPIYHIVVVDARRKTTTGAILEKIGLYYDFPHKKMNLKECHLDFERIMYWVGVGAYPTRRVYKLLATAGFVTPQSGGILPRGYDAEKFKEGFKRYDRYYKTKKRRQKQQDEL